GELGRTEFRVRSAHSPSRLCFSTGCYSIRTNLPERADSSAAYVKSQTGRATEAGAKFGAALSSTSRKAELGFDSGSRSFMGLTRLFRAIGTTPFRFRRSVAAQ